MGLFFASVSLLPAQTAADRTADALEGIDETLARQEARESRERLLEEAREAEAARRETIARQRRAQQPQILDLTSQGLAASGPDSISLEQQNAVLRRVAEQDREERAKKLEKLQAELLEAQIREAKARAARAEAEAAKAEAQQKK